MDQCTEIAPLLAAWIDGALDPPAADRVTAHVAACEACAADAAHQRAVRRLLQDRRDALTAERAPAALVARLQTLAPTAPAPRRSWRRLPLAVAATLALAASGSALHVATGRSATVLAAQLAADHRKCHLTETVRPGLQPAAVQDQLAARYGFHARVPPSTPDGRLELVGARRCLTGEGTNAHLLYRFDGQPVSLYLLPHSARADQSVEVFGERAHVWSRHNGTYVLVADPGVRDLPQVVDYMRRATH